MKAAKILIVSILLMQICSCNLNKNKSDSIIKNNQWINFEWEGDSIGTKYYDKMAMVIPFRLVNTPYTFKSQFDLGAPSTMVYGNTVQTLLEKYPVLRNKLDTMNKNIVIQGKEVGAFKDVSFYLDSVLFRHQQLAYFEGFGDTIKQEDLPDSRDIHIGTIGSNLFKDKVLIINFPEQKMAILDSLPEINGEKLVDIEINNGRILIPVIINNKKYSVLYDSGTSMASLFLSTKNWNSFRDTTSMVDILETQAWGIKYNLYQSKTNIVVRIGEATFRPDSIMANEITDYYDFYKRLGIIGIMGNKMFYNKTIVIDFKNNRFGII